MILRFTLDARSRDDWAFFSFDQGRAVETTLAGSDWDLAFQRTSVRTNSGVTNPDGHGGAINLGDVPITDDPDLSTAALVVDALDEDGDPHNAAIGRWYSYRFISHTIHVRNETYLVRTQGGADALVRFESYYCDDGDAGCITFQYRLLDPDL